MSSLLTIADINVSYATRPAVSGVTIDLQGGAITALLGPNGAGKSSLVQAIAGLVAASGRLELDGSPIAFGSADEVRRARIAVVPEGHRILRTLTVSENLQLATIPLPRRERHDALAPVLDVFPELVPLMKRLAGSLSGGEQQMLAIGQALVIAPRFLVIDELSLGLAPVVVRRLASAVQGIAQTGTGILLIEQFTELALELSTFAYVMARGRIVLSGSAEELRKSRGELAARYLGHQPSLENGAS